MRVRHLKTRFVLAGCMLVVATVGGNVWSAITFARLNGVVGDTLRVSRETIDRTAELADSLEREDDALLLFVAGDVEKARQDLTAERRRGDSSYGAIAASLQTNEDEERAIVADLRGRIDRYRAAGDELLMAGSGPGGLDRYHRTVNPLLRQAVAGCDKLREANFRQIEVAGVRARDEAGRGTWAVVVISALAVLIGGAVAVWLARSVLGPVRELTRSVEAVRLGDFDRRVPETTQDELGQLAAGFNRMAEALGEYRRSSLGDLLTAKMILEATLKALPDAVLVFGPGGSLVDANPPARAVLAAVGAETVAWLADLPLADDDRNAVEAALAGQPPGPRRPDFGRALTAELNGHPRRFVLTAVPIPKFSKGRFGAVAVLADVTEYARLDELRSELIGVASHELKSPLTALRMNLLMLGEGFSDMTARQRELLAAAIAGCEELGVTIEELLDVTRIEAGQLRLNLAPTEIGAALTASGAILRTRFEDAGVRIVLDVGPIPVVIPADPARLGSVLGNVLTNALKYSPPGGVVTVQLMSGQNAQVEPSGAVQITVTDQGPGVPAEFRERVFEKFFRVEHQAGRGENGVRGTGIGLYLCREIVRAHGGSIACEPGENGTGTRIAITLPAE
jgi:NtrC-family two-component system sensor histidine kinase KinB